MEVDSEIIINTSDKKLIKKKRNKSLIHYLILILILINIGIFARLFHYFTKKQANKNFYRIKENFVNKRNHTKIIYSSSNETFINKNNTNKINNTNENITFNENILKKFMEHQKNFCQNKAEYYNQNYENQISLVKAHFIDKYFSMYIYKKEDIVSKCIRYGKRWEPGETMNILRALEYYSSKKKLNNNNIYALDIGSNIGWYTLFLGKYGYNILSFEPSDLNYYILRKNYCLNQELNITIIKSGIYDEDRDCDFYISVGNIGDCWIFCDNNSSNISIPNHLKKSGKTKLSKLSNYVGFLSNKNLGLIKIDVEGSEARAIKSGIELVSKYHVPFIFLEYSPHPLKNHGTNPEELLNIFEENGYKFAKKNFFDTNYYSKKEIIATTYDNKNLYIVYPQFINS